MRGLWKKRNHKDCAGEKAAPVSDQGGRSDPSDRTGQEQDTHTGQKEEDDILVTQQLDPLGDDRTFSVVFSQIRTHTGETIRAVLAVAVCAALLGAGSIQGQASSDIVSETDAGEEGMAPAGQRGTAFLRRSGARVVCGACLQEGGQVLWYVSGIQGNVNAFSAVIGNTTCPVLAAGSVSENPMAPVRTVILVDNSASISQADRSRMEDLLSGLIDEHAENETFFIYTYAKEPQLLCEGTDYDAMKEKVQHLVFTDQYSWPVSVLDEVLTDMQGSAACRRVILITDGADDSQLGISCGELADRMEDQTYRCQIDTVFASSEKNRQQQRELAALSRGTGGQSWQLASYDTGRQLARVMAQAARPEYFLFQIPVQEKDGREKRLTLYLETDQGNLALSDTVSTPLRTESENQEMLRAAGGQQEETEELTQEQTEGLTQEETERITQPASEIIQEQPVQVQTESAQTQEADRPSSGAENLTERIMENPALAAGCGAVILGGFSAVLWLILSRGGKEAREGPAGRPEGTRKEHSRQNAEERPDSGKDRLLYGDSVSQGEGTFLMWAGSGEKSVYLTDMQDKQKHWVIQAGRETVLGRRSSACDICFPDDKTISGRHAKIEWDGEDILLTDLGSANGTFLNGSRITGRVQIREDDVISLGRISLLLTRTGGNEQ